MASNVLNIVVLGTLDTKLEEFLYLRSEIISFNPAINVILMDVGRSEVYHEAITIPQSQVHKRSKHEPEVFPRTLQRGEAIKIMIKGAIRKIKELEQQTVLHGMISLGGSGGTSVATAVMRQLPLNFPKFMVSTVASGDISSYIAETDITMMYSVVDIAGLNEVLMAVLSNAAAAIAGMAQRYSTCLREGGLGPGKKRIGITMFGVTTPAVQVARRYLEAQNYEVYVFHATGAGGRAMERLISEHRFEAILDLTTTELADEVAGGVFSAGANRLKAAAKAGIPQIVSVGAMDIINFGPRETLPKDMRHRNVLEHNPSVTMVRTSPEECKTLGETLARRLRENCVRPDLTEVWLPLRGISGIATEGQRFYDKEADAALFGAIKRGLLKTGIRVNEEDVHINDLAWAERMARRLGELLETKNGSRRTSSQLPSAQL